MYCIWHILEFNLCLLLVPAPPSLLFSSTISSSTQYLTAFSAAMSLTKSSIPLLSNYYNHCRPGCLFSQVFSQKCQVFFCPSCPSVCPPSVPCPFHFLNEYLKRNVKFDCRILKYVPKQDSWPNQIEINKKICSRKHECASTYGTYMLGTAELFMYWHNNIPITLYVKQKVLHVGHLFNHDSCTFCILYACDRWHSGSAWQHGNQTWFSLVSRWTRPDKFIHFYSVPFVVRSRESHR